MQPKEPELLTMRLEHFVNGPTSEDDFPTVWKDSELRSGNHVPLRPRLGARRRDRSRPDRRPQPGRTHRLRLGSARISHRIDRRAAEVAAQGAPARPCADGRRHRPRGRRDRAPASWEEGTTLAAALTTTLRDVIGRRSVSRMRSTPRRRHRTCVSHSRWTTSTARHWRLARTCSHCANS